MRKMHEYMKNMSAVLLPSSTVVNDNCYVYERAVLVTNPHCKHFIVLYTFISAGSHMIFLHHKSLIFYNHIYIKGMWYNADHI